MVLLSEEAKLKARFSLFEDSANLDARYVHGFALEVNLDAPDGTPR